MEGPYTMYGVPHHTRKKKSMSKKSKSKNKLMQFLFSTLLFVTTQANRHDVERQAFIKKINSMPNLNWKAGVNGRFKKLPVGHAKVLCGVKEESRSTTFPVEVRQADLLHDIPTNFDSATNWPQCAINECRTT